MKKFRTEKIIYLGECDSQGIVNYPNYFTWFDRNCQKLFSSVGLPLHKMFKEYDINGVPIVEATSKFKAPARSDDVVKIETWVNQWNGKIFIVEHRLIKDGDVVIEGREVRAWVVRDLSRPSGIRAAQVPEEVIARFTD